MTSQNDNFKSVLMKIKNDLAKHKHTDKTRLLEMYINERLQKSLTVYYQDVSNSLSYLSTSERDDYALAKRINK